jgi:hypothetical protein
VSLSRAGLPMAAGRHASAVADGCGAPGRVRKAAPVTTVAKERTRTAPSAPEGRGSSTAPSYTRSRGWDQRGGPDEDGRMFDIEPAAVGVYAMRYRPRPVR